MHPDRLQIQPQSRLKVFPLTARQWSAAALQTKNTTFQTCAHCGYIRLELLGLHEIIRFIPFTEFLALYDRRDSFRQAFGLDQFLFIRTRRSVCAASSWGSLNCRSRHAHELIGHAVGLLLVAVAGWIDLQLGLHADAAWAAASADASILAAGRFNLRLM
ncbi:MAG: hypothetical protein P8Z34_16725 [Anaerolineales bacterium]|jgi:hypothetical protein